MMKCYQPYCRIMDTTGGANCPDANACSGFDGTNPVKKQSVTDQPAHYQGDYECIDLMREIYGDDAVRSFCICNSYKYRFRAGKKQGNSAQDDIGKAEWYEAYIMEHLMKNGNLDWERIRKGKK